MPEHKTTTMRLRSVRFKSGGELRVLRPKPDREVLNGYERSSQNLIGGEVAADMVGYALVAWSRDNVFVAYRNGDRSTVPAGGVGQYVKDILDAEQAIRWSNA